MWISIPNWTKFYPCPLCDAQVGGPYGIKFMDSLMLLYVCVYLYVHVGQYSPGCIPHMLNAYYGISTLQGFS